MEHIAIDLDAVLDEFELNEDQAEVAAARLQKHIEQGRLEIASSDVTPGSSYTNSPRLSLSHVHDEPGRTESPAAYLCTLAEPTPPNDRRAASAHCTLDGATASSQASASNWPSRRLSWPAQPLACDGSAVTHAPHRPPATVAAAASPAAFAAAADQSATPVSPLAGPTTSVSPLADPTTSSPGRGAGDSSSLNSVAVSRWAPPAVAVSSSTSSAGSSDSSAPPGNADCSSWRATVADQTTASAATVDSCTPAGAEDSYALSDGVTDSSVSSSTVDSPTPCFGDVNSLTVNCNARVVHSPAESTGMVDSSVLRADAVSSSSLNAGAMDFSPPSARAVNSAQSSNALGMVKHSAVESSALNPGAADSTLIVSPANSLDQPPVESSALCTSTVPSMPDACFADPAASDGATEPATSDGTQARPPAGADDPGARHRSATAAPISDGGGVDQPPFGGGVSAGSDTHGGAGSSDSSDSDSSSTDGSDSCPAADTASSGRPSAAIRPSSPTEEAISSSDAAPLKWSMGGLDAPAPMLDQAVLVPDQTASIPDQTASIPDQTASIPDQTASIPDQTASIPDQTASIPDQTASIPDQTASIPDQTASIPDQTASIPDRAASTPNQIAPIPDQTASIPDQTASIPDQTASIPDQVASAPNQAAPIRDQTAAEPDLSSHDTDPAVPALGGPKPVPVEPVRFQPAVVSDSELQTYLDQLEQEPPEPEPPEQELFAQEPPEQELSEQAVSADAVFGGARPKTAAAPTESPSAGLDALKGSVISRLHGQVTIECVVDSRGGRAESEPTRASPPPTPPVRPSSLDLPTRTQPGGAQEVSDGATDEDAASAGAESVSTTGGNIVTAPGAYEEARLAAGRPAAAAGRGQLVSLSDEDKNLGKVAPVWVPDEQAAACMECELKFTVIRRRHHCRACGRVLCSACCGERICLDYMQYREARVCGRCKDTIDRVQQESRVVAAAASPAALHQHARPPNPNNPMEYCSTVPPTQQATPNAPPPTVMVPTGVLKRTEGSGGRTPSRETKQVMFSDGIRPGGDLSEPTPQSRTGVSLCRPPHRRTARLARGSDRSPAAILRDAKGCKDLAWKPDSGKLPPIYQAGCAGSSIKQSTPEETIVSMIRAEKDLPWSFLINKNLMVVVKIFKLDCCVGRTCWIFTSHGLPTVGQEEVVVVLESLPQETTVPKDVFFFYHHLFAEASKGNFVSELGHTLFSVPLLGSKDHGGFLYVRPTFQCLHNIPCPPQPFLVALLIQKWEAPWAKVFPLRLLLRLGAEFRYYPCPLVSVRHRKPVFFEVGHTIINLLADFRNFAYVLPTVHGMRIHMEEQQTSVLIPRNRFNQVLKAINNSNDHVLALGASFSREADSHLVCMQNEDGQYQTQAINIQNRPRQVTGASFVVFNGALKSAAGVTAKSSIVEDGLMFQVSSDTMQVLRSRLRQMQDYRIECGAVGQPPDEVINIKWVEDDRNHNLGVRSVIDDMPLDGVPSIRVHSGTDYVGDTKLIRWTEIYLIKVTESTSRPGNEPPDFSRLSEQVARGSCVALTPHLRLLAESERTRIGLRLTIDSDTVGYEAGSNGERLPPGCMELLDSELVPVLHRHAAEVPDCAMCLELLFHVIDR